MSAMQRPPTAEAVKMQKLVRLKKFDELESALLDAIGTNEMTLNDLESILQVVAEQNDPSRAESLFWLALTSWTEHQGVEAGLEAARRIAGLLPQSETLRTETAEIYRKSLANTIPQAEVLLEMTLLRRNTPLALAVRQMDKLAELLANSYILDTLLKVPGRMVGLDAEKKELTVVLAGEEKGYDATAVLKLEPLSSDDFRARTIFEKEHLQTLAEEDPEEFVRLALKTFGPALSFRDLKSHLTTVIGSGGWTKWWSKAKAQLHRSALIEMTETNQPTLTLRAKPLAYEERLRRQFEDTPSFEDKLVIILNYLSAHPADSAPDDSLMETFSKSLHLCLADSDPGPKWASRATLTAMAKKFPKFAGPADFPSEPLADPAMLLMNVYNDDVARLILNHLRETQPQEWRDLWAGIMPGASAVICDWIASELIQTGIGEPLARAVETILHWPDKFVRGIVWLYKAACTGQPPEYLAKIDQATIMTGLISAAQVLKRKSPLADPEQQRRALTQIKNALSADDYALVWSVLEKSSHDYAGYLKDTVPRNTGLGDAMGGDILKIIRETHPSLFGKALPPWEEDAIYTTQAAMDRRNEEFAKLVNVDIAHNAKSIGEAADRGDLSENAEFTAALEERDRLTERAGRMRAELKKAKVIHHGLADTDFVTVGSRVRAVNLATNETETLLFLGPWDADPQRAIYSYLSPIARSFMGKKVGEVVIHESNAGQSQWKIEEITPGI